MGKMKTVADFLRWEPYLSEESRAALLSVKCPSSYDGRDVPQDLNSMTLEGLARLWMLSAVTPSAELFKAAGKAVLGLGEDEVMKAPLLPMIGVVNMVVRELPGVADKWAMIDTEHTSIELQAGVQKLNFGIFGLADWYAQRMGMTDHDEAFATPWLRVWQCSYNDTQKALYERRLNALRAEELRRQAARRR